MDEGEQGFHTLTFYDERSELSGHDRAIWKRLPRNTGRCLTRFLRYTLEIRAVFLCFLCFVFCLCFVCLYVYVLGYVDTP